ncbi:MAG: WD40/YVTN/BNR-like repeat-containing protein [Chloroflexota bacterium]
MTPSNPEADTWEQLAAHAGGTVADLAAAPDADGTLVIFAATPAGVFRSLDDGRTWRQCGLPGALPFVTSVAPSPVFAVDRTVFAGTLIGLFRSRDGGESWQPVLAGGAVLALAISPAFAEDRTLFMGTAEDGVVRSEDGGDRWLSANAGLLDLTVQCLALSERFQDDGSAYAGTASGLYRSRNGGKSWQEVDLGEDEVSVQAVSIGPRLPGVSWVAVGTEEHGILLSDDDGRSWFDVPELAGQSVGAIATWMTPAGGLGIDAVLDRTVLRSVDDGASWQPIGTMAVPVLTLLSLRQTVSGDGMELLAGLVGQGVVRVSPSGQEQTPANDGLTATLLTMLAVSPSITEDDTLFAASADGTVLVSRDRGRSLDRVALPVEDASVTGLVISPRFPEDATAWLSTADVLLRTQDGGETWTVLPVNLPTDALGDGAEIPALRLLAVACEGGQVVLFLADGATVGRSDDNGEHWQWLSPFPDGQEVMRLVALPQRDGGMVLYAATRGNGVPAPSAVQAVWRSPDGGRRWEPWLEIEGASDVVLLGWDGPPSEPNLLVAVDNTVHLPRSDARERRVGVHRPLWRTVDLGPAVSRISSLATPPEPRAGRTIYAGTDAGVYVSRDGGHSFEPWNDSMVSPPIQALAAVADGASFTVFASGSGGALWRRLDR